MNDLDKPFAKLAAVPWRGALFVLGASFLVASSISTVLARVFMPTAKSAASTAVSTINVPGSGASLNAKALDLIFKRNIFNSEGPAVDDAKANEEAKPEAVSNVAVKSDLPITLVGTIFGGDPFSGIALIENSQKKTINSFFVGDTVLKEATVKEIYKERIIVDRGGRREYIEIAPTELTRSRRKKKTAAPSSSSQTIAPIATEPPPSSFKEEGFERDKTAITMTGAYRNKLLTVDFTKVLQDCKATPNMVDGELKGFQVTRIRKDSIYEKAGLQNDDIVEEINGVPLTDTAQAIRLLQSLKNEPEIDIRVRRAGSPMNFVIAVR